MDFTDVPLRRAVPAGVVAYLVGYSVTYLAVASRAEALLREVDIEIPYGGGVQSFYALVEPAPETWKAVGWFFHSAQFSSVVNPQLSTGQTITVGLVSRVGGELLALYLVAPVVLIAVGYAVAQTGRTYGVRGEDYAGAAIVFGYLPLAAVGGLLYTVGRPAVGPSLLTSIFLVGVAYPVVFGWVGGRVARLRESAADSATPTPTRE